MSDLNPYEEGLAVDLAKAQEQIKAQAAEIEAFKGAEVMTKFNEAQQAFLEKMIQFKGADPSDGFNVWGSVRGDVWGNVGGNGDDIVARLERLATKMFQSGNWGADLDTVKDAMDTIVDLRIDLEVALEDATEAFKKWFRKQGEKP